MLVVARRTNEEVHIGSEIIVKIVYHRGNLIGIGITAPQGMDITRPDAKVTKKKIHLLDGLGQSPRLDPGRLAALLTS